MLRALRAALGGAGPAVGLGSDAHGVVPAGTAAVVTTSGSSGYPKSVVLSRHALTASAMATSARLGEGAWLLALPAHYVAGLQVLVRALVSGHEPAILAGSFSAQAFAAASLSMASSVGGNAVPRFTSLVPAQLLTLLDAAENDDTVARAVRSFEAILIGGQALPVRVRERAAEAEVRIVRTYGSSETSGGCVYDGRPLDDVSLRVVAGEVHITGPTLAEGYLGDPDRTDAAFIRDAAGTRWYRTGDAGRLENGFLHIDGRIDNVIISGGINVSLDRVETAVRSLAGWESAVVVAATDERWGEASVVVRAGERVANTPDFAEVRSAVGEELGAPARPARVLMVDEIPTLPSGKPDRVALRAIVASGAQNGEHTA
ncbi:O-succinylbenzoic acid--CoA ligase [Microbacterium endophyticum]|uniref:O-succinylbenzoic acid--CoA ligase n=1 Tax=Microbacterium endophyticum TaxID=1526412 RepID=A0A7W4V4G9_9MICO|nr:AMP-binding protein [Microbacterium endophyticum]MBB2976677.1 O-succinylbenzoic acid--CoA ligase [Microbacterium endophyticum]NIK37638.1 O-succinylbenzoic acid--CoA ligase [Microbacterium endophyticum]